MAERAPFAEEAITAARAAEAERLRRLGTDPSRGWVFNQDEADIAALLQVRFGIQLIRWPGKAGPD